MTISGSFFDDIQDKGVFLEKVHRDFYARSEEMGVLPHWNKACALDAYFQWRQDLRRIEGAEALVANADHFKCAAHLIYWLRRSSPVYDFAVEGEENSPSVEFMLKYGREYLAFDLGYRAVQVYEVNINGRNLPPNSFSLTSALQDVGNNDFLENVVHFLKMKNVSPHAIYLVLKAIFLRP